MSETEKKTKFAKRINHHYVRKLVWVLIILGICCILYREIGDRVLLPIAKRQIREMTGAEVFIGKVDFEPTKATVRMRNIRIKPKNELHVDNILTATQLEGRFSIWSMLKFNPRLRELVLTEVDTTVLYNTESKTWNLGTLNFAKSSSDGELPIVKLRDGIIKIQTVTKDIIKPLKVIGIDGEFAASAEKNNVYDFHVTTKDEFTFGGSELKGTWKTGPDGHLEIQNGSLLMGDTPLFGNNWNMRDLYVSVEYNDKDISAFELSFRSGRTGQISFSGKIGNYREDAGFEVNLRTQEWDLAAGSGRDRLVYNEELLEKLGPGLGGILRRYNPQGLGDIDVTFSGKVSDLANMELEGTITCTDVSVLDSEFPYLLKHMNGTLEVTEDSVFLKDLRCKHGSVDLLINGHSRKVGDQIDSELRMTSNNMILDEDLYKALNRKQKEMWFTFAPSGPVSIDYRTKREPGQAKEGTLDVKLKGAQAVYQHFPYPLKNLRGNLSFTKNAFILQDVMSQYDSRTITLNGEVTGTDTERPRFNITIEANDIPIDSTLKAALPSKQRAFYESFEVNAITDVKITVFPNEVGRRLVEYIAEATIKDASLIYEKFPLPLTGVNVQATLTPDVVILKEMTGRNGEGRIRADGLIWPGSNTVPQTGFCVNLEAYSLELRDEWLHSLPEKASDIVKQLNPTGQVDIDAKLNFNAPQEDCSTTKITITCLGNSINYAGFPYPIENLTGKITITDGRAELEDITVKDLVIGEQLKKALAENRSALFDKLKPAGTMDLTIPQASYYTDESENMWVDFQTELVLKDFSLGKEKTLEKMNSTGFGKGLYKVGSGLTKGTGTFNSQYFKIKDREITNLTSSFVYDPNAETFVCKEFKADCYGGRLIGELLFSVPSLETMEYTLEVVFDNVGVEHLISEKFVAPERPQDARRASTSGVFTSSGNLMYKDSHIGRLGIDIRNIQLAKRSLMGKIITAVQLDDPTDYMFDRIKIDAYLKGKELVFELVQMTGKSANLEGGGTFDLNTMTVNLNFNATAKAGTEETFIGSIADALGSALIKVHVTGNIENPKITTDTLPVITKPFEILGSNR